MEKLTGWRAITNLGVGKFRLPRLLNWLARYLLSFAHFLDPNNKAIKKNLLFLGGTVFQKTRKNKYDVLLSVPAGCALLKQKIHFFHVDQYVSLSKPKVLNSDFIVSPLYEATAQLPDTYLAELDNALVFGGTDLIVVSNKTVLYDELAYTNKNYYANKSPAVKFFSDKFITIEKNTTHSQRHIEKGIHFVKDHSANYFHWLIECLPRLLLVNQMPELKNIPLLVDENIASQQLEALHLLNEGNRELIMLGHKSACSVEKLFYPSQLSIIHDNMKNPVRYNEDVFYSPIAVNFIRDFFLQKLKISQTSGFRKLYVSRSNAEYRKLINADEIEELMLFYDFQVVFPEKLTFSSQVKLFSQAKIVVGQSGAGMANLLFVPKDCQALIFFNDSKQTNLQIFNALCDQIGIDTKFLIGKSASNYKDPMHSDFTIDIDLLVRCITS